MTAPTHPLNILVIGDPFFGIEIFAAQFGRLALAHRVRFCTIEDADAPTAAETEIDEYIGTPEQVIDLLHADDDVLVVHGAPVTARVLHAAPALKLICVGRGGPVNVDRRAAADRGVQVVTTPGKNAEAVSELTLALMIMLARGIPQSSAHLRGSDSSVQSAFEGAQWFGRELGGARLGLVGLGRVGRCVAERATAFGMHIHAVDPFLQPTDFPPDVECTGLDRLLATSDFVSLHARATPDNVGMFGADQFRMMRNEAYFVNTARASLVDEVALADAVTGGMIAGAALDVIGPHAGGLAHPLTTIDRVIATPHIGGSTTETLVRGARIIAEQLERYAALEFGDDPTPLLTT